MTKNLNQKISEKAWPSRREKVLSLTNDPVLIKEMEKLFDDYYATKKKSNSRKRALRSINNSVVIQNNIIRSQQETIFKLRKQLFREQ